MQFDEDLIERIRAGDVWAYRSWEPAQYVVVLGRGNHADADTYPERCRADGIPILRRQGGGGTVVLSPGVLVVSVAKQVKHRFLIHEYFQQINQVLIEALETLGIRSLTQQGHSDLCLGDRKILGASMYRSRQLLFYTASLMVSNNLTVIDRYLKHPSKEPEYRRGRSHHDFLTTLQREYPHITLAMVKASLDALMPQRIMTIE